MLNEKQRKILLKLNKFKNRRRNSLLKKECNLDNIKKLCALFSIKVIFEFENYEEDLYFLYKNTIIYRDTKCSCYSLDFESYENMHDFLNSFC